MATKWTQLIDLREAAGISQYELARRLKISRSALGNYENGLRQPDFETLTKLADFFGVTVDHLLGRGSPSGPMVFDDIPSEWRKMIALARNEGYDPDQVLQALRLMDSIKRQQQELQKQERER